REESKTSQPIATLASVPSQSESTADICKLDLDGGVQDVGLDCGVKLRNSDVLANLDKKLCHLSEKERNELKDLILEYKHLFPDTPGKTDAIYHDVDV
ncbi:hypothetical protein ScPMuIL_018598, partial [Solemya velum]